MPTGSIGDRRRGDAQPAAGLGSGEAAGRRLQQVRARVADGPVGIPPGRRRDRAGERPCDPRAAVVHQASISTSASATTHRSA